MGEGPPIVLLHGLTATRRYVVQGSKVLPRQGFRTIAYDARGHGRSDPAPAGKGYGYDELAEDLGAAIDKLAGDERPVLAGHSMGAHTAVAHALAASERIAALVVICPASIGVPPPPEELAEWDELADALEGNGVEGFMRVYGGRDLDPRWRETILRFTGQRLERHEHPRAVAQALREVPRSLPFQGLAELESLSLPTLVVGSRDQADPSHPLSVAQAYAERIPATRLFVEAEGDSPLAWQGARLSRAIAAFCAEPAVRERHLARP